MKKTIIVTTLTVLAAVGLFGRDIKMETFRRVVTNEKGTISGWSNSTKVEKDTVQVFPGRKGGTKACQIKTTGNSLHYYTSWYPVTTGEVITFTAEIKGKGKAFLQLNLFGEKGKGYIKPQRLVTADAKEEWTKITGSYVVEKAVNGKEIKTIRIVFGVEPESKVMFETLKVTGSAEEEDDA